ncbi:MAG: L,D-transpeptidase [Candidatus Nomurabacteria bacterium]|jgi:lipoprotein-anchoring transpeptidase ErfK/SrfK|nr:L,D-transpeptidase [Candidatus Nomurabacteria bacterium]
MIKKKGTVKKKSILDKNLTSFTTDFNRAFKKHRNGHQKSFHRAYHGKRRQIHDRKEQMPRAHRILVRVGCSAVGLIAVLLVGAAIALPMVFDGKALPGTFVGGREVSGKTRDEVAEIVAGKVADLRITFHYGDISATADAETLGLFINQAGTVEDTMSAKSNRDFFTKYIPFVKADTPLAAVHNQTLFEEFIEKSFGSAFDKVSEPALLYNDDSKAFDVVSGKDGYGVNLDDLVAHYINDELANPRPIDAELSVEHFEPKLPLAAAEAAKATADEYLKQQLNFNSSGRRVYFIDPIDIAGFMIFTPNAAAGTLDISFSDDHIQLFVNERLIPAITNQPANKRVLVDAGDGRELATLRAGIDGRTPKDPEGMARAIKEALASRQVLNYAVEMTVKPFGTETTTIDDRRWIEANLSNYCVYLHIGDEVVTVSCETSHGKASTPTITGEFRVYSKTFNQCMPNPPDPKPLCNIHYVTYWGAGGYAFHEAWWLSYAKGNVRTGISHGCINMFAENAKTVYDFAEIGMRVWVHY